MKFVRSAAVALFALACCAQPCWAQDVSVTGGPVTIMEPAGTTGGLQTSNTPEITDPAPVIENPEAAAATTGAVSPDAQAVWWGNRSVSYRNYIPFNPAACPGICKYCDKNMIDCQTGCPCVSCEYICENCDDCPPQAFDKIMFGEKKTVLSPNAVAELDQMAAYLYNTFQFQ